MQGEDGPQAAAGTQATQPRNAWQTDWDLVLSPVSYYVYFLIALTVL